MRNLLFEKRNCTVQQKCIIGASTVMLSSRLFTESRILKREFPMVKTKFRPVEKWREIAGSMEAVH